LFQERQTLGPEFPSERFVSSLEPLDSPVTTLETANDFPKLIEIESVRDSVESQTGPPSDYKISSPGNIME
jgi:hypothetical protein